MKKIIFALALVSPLCALAGLGEGGPGFGPGRPGQGPIAGRIVLQCDGLNIYYGTSPSPLIPPHMYCSLSENIPVTSTTMGDMKVYENSRFRLEMPLSVDSLGPSASFSATLIEEGATSTEICRKGPAF